jgi:hypothetical protein
VVLALVPRVLLLVNDGIRLEARSLNLRHQAVPGEIVDLCEGAAVEVAAEERL